MLNLHHIIGQPWAVTAELAEFGKRLLEAEGIQALRMVAEIHKDLNSAEAQARAASSRRGGDVAIVPVLGLLTHRGDMVESASTTSTAEVAQYVRSLAAEPSVSAIVMEFDSPGGEVAGMPEAAEVLREARKAKPLVAAVNTKAGSGGYWLASQADEVIVTPSGLVGSVGVFYPHEDKSAEMAAKGRKVTLVSAGKYKTEGNPYEALGDEARGYLQGRVDDAYAMFVSDIARGRGVSREAVRDGFGQGRMVGAKAAVEAGMASAVGTLEDAVRRAASLAAERRRASATVAQAQADRFRRERA